MVENQNPGSPDEFSVVLAKFDDKLGTSILDPHPEKFSGVNYVRFYLSGHVAYVKVDQRKTPLMHSKFILSENKPLYIIARNLMGSKELRLMKSFVNS
jgi:hypothetical protein